MTDNKREKILIILTFLVYGISYVSRYTYNSSVNAITSYYNITSAEFGLVGTCFFAMYGIGQFVNGILCKRYNKRIVMPVSLMISAVLNFILFFQPDFRVYKYLWFINGASLSLLWSSLSETVSKYVSKQNINKAIVALSASLAAGTVIVYSLSALFSELGIYQYVFLSATILCVLVSTIWFIMFPTIKNRDNPIEIGEIENEIINKETSKKSRSYFVIVIIFLGILAAVCNLLKFN